MDDLYNRIEKLCQQAGVRVGTMCREIGIGTSVLADLKSGRKKSLSTVTISKIAGYFNVSIDYLLGADTEKAPTREGGREMDDDALMFALWGDAKDIDKDDLEDVKRYAAFVRERKRKK